MTTTTEILATGSTTATSSTVEVGGGQSATLILHGTGGVEVQILGADSTWVLFTQLNPSEPTFQLGEGASYRVIRWAGQTAAVSVSISDAANPVTLASDDPAVTALDSIDAKTPALVLGAQPVNISPRTCLGTYRLSVTTTAATLPALVMAVGGPGIPAGAVVCELQADGGTVRLSRDNTVTPTATNGYRLDDGLEKVIDSTLSHVRLIAAATTPVNATFFDRV